MRRTFLSLIVLTIAGVATPMTASAQLDAVHEFDGGGDVVSWDDPVNWEQVSDAIGNPVNGDPAAPPDAFTSADIPLVGVQIDGTMAPQAALDVQIGTPSGAGSLTISGSVLTARDVLIGSGVNPGVLDVTGGDLIANDDITVSAPGSSGTLRVSSGVAASADDLIINANGSVEATGGQMTVGDRLSMFANASMLLDGAQVFVEDDLFALEDSLLQVTAGLLQVADRITLDASPLSTARLLIDGGIVRSSEFGDGLEPLGVIEINDTGLLQIEMLSVMDAMDLILEGEHFVSSSGVLMAEAVLVDLPGRPDVMFTQISVGPPRSVSEPGLLGLLAVALFAPGRTRRHRRARTVCSGARPR